ncbi:MAG: LysR family transcriptional regulator substrate-binding protein, partial [Oscillospiraceae bacterium]|nr:LysR family transcriptional regulator substrate-binding protein [Oscillospiraceae bacterium]
TSGALLLPELMAEFHALHPKVTFELWEGEGSRILELLDNRVIEIGITRTQVDLGAYESIVLPNEPLVLIAHRSMEVGEGEDHVHVRELEGRPLIVPLRWKSLFEANCRRIGFEPEIVCISDSIVQDLLLAKMGMGLAILPISSRTLLTDGDLTYKKLIEPEITTHTVIAWMRNRPLSVSARQMIALFRRHFPDSEEHSSELAQMNFMKEMEEV